MKLWDLYHTQIPEFLAEAAQIKQLQRLKGVGMNCGCEYTSFPLFAGIGPYSRYDHSMGVALIVWHFTGDMAQALSGLLHDIATPAFAHVVDFLNNDHMNQESTENRTEEIIRGAEELTALLRKYGLSVESVVDYHRYPIADNDSPKLSSDRLEYTLSNLVNYGIVTREQIEIYYRNLLVGTNEYGKTELVFGHPEIGYSFAMNALKCSKIYVSDEDRYAMQALADLMKQAIESGILSTSDLYSEEAAVIGKLKNSCISSKWEQFCGYRELICQQEKPAEDGQWLRVFSKKRMIDPYINNQGRVSSIFPEFAEQLRAFGDSSFDYWMKAK